MNTPIELQHGKFYWVRCPWHKQDIVCRATLSPFRAPTLHGPAFGVDYQSLIDDGGLVDGPISNPLPVEKQ